VVRKSLSILTVLFICALCFEAFWTHVHSIPPSDAALVKQFYDHRSDFEKLRAMLQKDSNICEVATYGVSTTNRNEIDPLTPAMAGLTQAHYEEYLATLKKAGASLAFHKDGEFVFLVKRWGFAGEGWGIAVLSRDIEPTKEIRSLDDFSKRPLPESEIYRHVEANWYLWMHYGL
jgi:glutamine cyclotransferase